MLRVSLRNTSMSRRYRHLDKFSASSISDRDMILQNQLQPLQMMVSKRDFSYQEYLETINSGVKYISDSKLTTMFMDQYVTLHEFTGMPWWAIILGSSIFYRGILMFPAQIFTQHVIVRRKLAIEELETKTIPALKRVVNAKAKKNLWTFEQTKRHFQEKELQLIEFTNVKYNCVRKKMYLPQYIQMPVWMSMTMAWYKLISSSEYRSEFLTQGPILMSDLISAPTTPFLPLCIGLLFVSSIQVNLLLHRIEKQSTYGKFMLGFSYGLVSLLVYMSSLAPNGIGLYWAGSAAAGLASNLILVSPKAKTLFRIKSFPNDPEKPYQAMYENAMHKYETLGSKTIPALKYAVTAKGWKNFKEKQIELIERNKKKYVTKFKDTLNKPKDTDKPQQTIYKNARHKHDTKIKGASDKLKPK